MAAAPDLAPRWQDELYDLLRANQVHQFAYVPDAGHRILIDRSLADPGAQSVALTTEEECVALLAGETGYQRSHTSLGVDLERIAAASGIRRSRTVANEAHLAEGARLLREGNGTAFVVLRVKPDDPAACRVRFRTALIGPG